MGYSALILAAKANQTNVIGCIMKLSGRNAFSDVDYRGCTALHHASGAGNLEAVAVLLKEIYSIGGIKAVNCAINAKDGFARSDDEDDSNSGFDGEFRVDVPVRCSGDALLTPR